MELAGGTEMVDGSSFEMYLPYKILESQEGNDRLIRANLTRE